MNVPDFVPTPGTNPYTVVALVRLVTGGFAPENIAQCSTVAFGVFGVATTTNQKAAGSSPAGRTIRLRSL
jgi:hypothetical protein